MTFAARIMSMIRPTDIFFRDNVAKKLASIVEIPSGPFSRTSTRMTRARLRCSAGVKLRKVKSNWSQNVHQQRPVLSSITVYCQCFTVRGSFYFHSHMDMKETVNMQCKDNGDTRFDILGFLILFIIGYFDHISTSSHPTRSNTIIQSSL